jgi:hypothetical protein
VKGQQAGVLEPRAHIDVQQALGVQFRNSSELPNSERATNGRSIAPRIDKLPRVENCVIAQSR